MSAFRRIATLSAMIYAELTFSPRIVAAWTPFWSTCSPQQVRWESPSSGFRFITLNNRCIAQDGWLPGTPAVSDMVTAGSWAHWMWYRDFGTRVIIDMNTSPCGSTTSRSNWMNSSTANQYAFDRMNDSYPMCPVGSIACARFKSQCPAGPANPPDYIQNGRIVIRTDTPWLAAQINTIERCLTPGAFIEHAYIHEVGHLYGFDHNDAWQTAMNSVVNNHHHCNVGSGFHDQPYSDESQAIRFYYGNDTSVNGVNISGTPIYLDPNTSSWRSSGTGIPLYICGAYSAQTSFIYMNHYAALPGSGVLQYRARLYASNVSNPAAASALWSSSTFSFGSTWTFAGATYRIDNTWSVPSSSVPPQGARLWIELDPNNAYIETDEGDNMIPTGHLFLRAGGPSC
jgi:hypothetical protein